MSSDFENRLLTRLRSVVAEDDSRSPSRSFTILEVIRMKRKALIGIGGATLAVGAAAAIGLPMLLGGSPAYAVEAKNDGKIEIIINEYDDEDGLERAIEGAGIKADVNYLPDGKMCDRDRFEKAPGSDAVFESTSKWDPDEVEYSFTVDTNKWKDEWTLVVQAVGTDSNEGGSSLNYQAAEGDVKPCDPQDAPHPPDGPN